MMHDEDLVSKQRGVGERSEVGIKKPAGAVVGWQIGHRRCLQRGESGLDRGRRLMTAWWGCADANTVWWGLGGGRFM